MTDARRIEQAFIPGPSIQLGNGEIVELSWQERALCAQTDPEAFFPEKGGSTREAKRVCLSCEVRQECLEYALAHDERFGIWADFPNVNAADSSVVPHKFAPHKFHLVSNFVLLEDSRR